MKIEEVLAHPWITKYIEPEFKELREQAIQGVRNNWTTLIGHVGVPER